jgi:pre-mRNA-splicing factor ISY1
MARGAAAQWLEEWRAKEAEREAALADVAGGVAGGDLEREAPAPQFVAYVPLPDQALIEARVLERKKADLLNKYTSAALAQEQQSAKALLNKQ